MVVVMLMYYYIHGGLIPQNPAGMYRRKGDCFRDANALAARKIDKILGFVPVPVKVGHWDTMAEHLIHACFVLRKGGPAASYECCLDELLFEIVFIYLSNKMN